jgi:cobalt transporter subunit CbtA
MMVFQRLLICALLAGLGAGFTSSAVQRWSVIPIINAAEAYESAHEANAKAVITEETIKQVAPPVQAQLQITNQVKSHDHASHEHDGHDHDASAWAPKDGVERTFWTVVANVFTSFGFALILLPAIAWWDLKRDGNAATFYTGLIWGAVGWLCFFLWPALGMRPELPGEVSASLQSRQTWWILTVACACIGFGFILTVRSQLRWLGLVFLALPFLIGAPKIAALPFSEYSAEIAMQMEILAKKFFTATALTNAAQWLVLGAISGLLVPHRLRSVLSEARHSN